MNVLVTGAGGFVGCALVRSLHADGHRVITLGRGGVGACAAIVDEHRRWDPTARALDPSCLVGAHAVVHLAGEPLAAGRWSAKRKTLIRESRVRGTSMLCEALARAGAKTLVCASAVGVYGDRGDEILSEASAPGSGFLAEVCRDWEGATEAAERAGVRVVRLRIGVVLARAGGALAKMLPAFRLGVGGAIGSGAQWMSFVTRTDLVRIVARALEDEALRGPLNAVSPTPATNRDFTAALARLLRRPSFVRVPAFAARFAFGEVADAALLASQRAVPARLLEVGFSFEHGDLAGALTAALADDAL